MLANGALVSVLPHFISLYNGCEKTPFACQVSPLERRDSDLNY